MYSCVIVLALAVFGASATLVTPGYVYGNAGYGNFATPVSDVCNCVKTVVRPHIRTEVAAVPTVQRFVRTETTPVIERIPYFVNRRIDGAGYVNGGVGGVVSGRSYSGLNGFGGNRVGVISGVTTMNSGYVY